MFFAWRRLKKKPKLIYRNCSENVCVEENLYVNNLCDKKVDKLKLLTLTFDRQLCDIDVVRCGENVQKCFGDVFRFNRGD